MKPGLYLFQIPSGYRAVIRIGWLRPEEGTNGEEWECWNQVTPRRGESETMLVEAQRGPPAKWKGFTEPSPSPVSHLRIQISDPRPLDAERYTKVCPRPENWPNPTDPNLHT